MRTRIWNAAFITCSSQSRMMSESEASTSSQASEAATAFCQEPQVDVDTLTAKLVKSVEESHYINVSMSEDEIRATLDQVRGLFLSQPMFLELHVPVNICGDIHGQFSDLIRIFKARGFPPKTNYLFLGDYVDRGKNSLETIILLFLCKIKNPNIFFLLRGNHETAEINRVYGFYDEMCRRFSTGAGPRLWKKFQDVFSVMPVAALVEDKILCMHGGIPHDLNSAHQAWDEIREIERPCVDTTDGIVCDLLWADPGKEEGWNPNGRGVSWLFGPDALKRFCDDKGIDLVCRAHYPPGGTQQLRTHQGLASFQFCDNKGIDLVCRAHQVIEDGYELTKDSGGRVRLATVFSAPNYCGQFNNKGALLKINDQLRCSFHVIKPSKLRMRKDALKDVTDRVPSTYER